MNISLITLLPIIENSAQQDEGLIFLIQPSRGQMLWDTLDLCLAKSKSELGIILQGKRDRAPWDLSPKITAMHNTLFSFQTLLPPPWALLPSQGWDVIGGVSSPPSWLSPGLSPSSCPHPELVFTGKWPWGCPQRWAQAQGPCSRGHLWSQGQPAQQVQSCPETWDLLVLDQSTDFCNWWPKSPLPSCSFSPDSEPLAGLDLEVQF